MSRVKDYNQYTFLVGLDANKIEIKQAVEKEYNVHVLKVSTLIRKGKTYATGRKRVKKIAGNRKFAIVTIKEGEKIEEFEIK